MNKSGQTIPVVLTVDTEPDDAWTNHLNPSVANVQELRRLQLLLDRYGAKATCLITYKVVQDDRCVDLLRELVDESGAEVGAHLHPWENPPFMGSGVDVDYASYPHELPLDFFEKKLTCLTEAITQRLQKPTSYRAGRWGWVAPHISVLESLGYSVDSSVVPWMDFRPNMGIPASIDGGVGGCGGIDYSHAPREPYHPDYADARCKGDALLLEVPVSVGFTRRVPSSAYACYGYLPTLAQRVLRKSGVLRPVWTLPAQQPREDLENMIRTLLGERPSLINIGFHSSELMLDGSIRSRTKEELDGVFDRIETLLAAVSADGDCKFTTLSEAARLCQGGSSRTEVTHEVEA